jgi:glycosyltransferase involved in cell wall biosynthesis
VNSDLRQMRIAIICSSFFPVIDGVTIAVYQRLEYLSKLGHQLIVLCPDYSSLKHIYPDFQSYTGEIFPGVEIVNLPSTKAIALDFERDLTLKSNQLLLKKLARFQPDLIHVDEAERLGFCLLKLPGIKYARQQQIPCVAWFHTNYVDYLDDYLKLPRKINGLIKKILGFIFAKIYNAYDVTLVSSSLTARKIRQMGIKNISCAELLGCDLSQFNQTNKTTSFFAESYNLSGIESKLKLIFMGRLTPDKGWAFALQTLVITFRNSSENSNYYCGRWVAPLRN